MLVIEEFVKTHGLKVGDYMVLYKDEEGKLVCFQTNLI
jgi:hypothetical protein